LLPDLKDDALARYTTILSEKYVGLVRIEERHKSLEDIFLELTDWR
jgi:ABC-2 type transport system ATP-binding protein